MPENGKKVMKKQTLFSKMLLKEVRQNQWNMKMNCKKHEGRREF